MPKRILFIMHLPPPVHGAAIVNSNIANSELINNSFNTKTIKISFVSEINQIGKFSIKKILLIFPMMLDLIKSVITFKPDLVYYTIAPKGFAFYRDSLLVMVMKILRLKIVFHLHSRGIQNSIKSSKLKKIIYICVFKNTHVISLAHSLNYEFEGLQVKSIHVLPNGIANHQLNTDTEKSSIPTILFLANLFKNKGIYIFLDIIKNIKSQGISFKANIVGKNGDISTSELTLLVEKYNISDITVVSGALYGAAKYKAFEEASIFVHPSLDEAFPLTILEAMQAKLPVIGSSVGAIPEMIIDSETGFICPPGDVECFCEKLKLLLTNNSTRKEMGEKSFNQYKQNYTIQQFENNLKKIIDDLL